jgi:hypothetical protein
MKEIVFHAHTEYVKNVSEPPIPAIQALPEWYKSWNPHLGIVGIDNPLDKSLISGKSCAPFFDAMTAGYYLVLFDDIHVTINDLGLPYITWNGQEPVLDTRPRKDPQLPTPSGCDPTDFVWKLTFAPRLPKGYSALITHPLNRNDLPFITSSGIIDSDVFHNTGNIPFYIKKGFEGYIPAGTPYAQVIPIKRESWKSSVSEETCEKGRLFFIGHKYIHTKKRGAYKRYFWQKKEYK